MKNLKELCEVRQSVFDKSRRDVTLDITDLTDNKIDTDQFFRENFITDGMKSLYTSVFKRLEGSGDDGIFRLTQAMGGGKTHSMITVGLLAKYPEYRSNVMGEVYETSFRGAANVIGFSGREQPKYGIWGYIAEKLGKKELFNDYYDPLEAPGQSAWIRLLKGDPLLILLDELPPYFEGAFAKQIGDGNLASVTTQALSNLLVAVGKSELANVAVVISDLSAAYDDGSGMIRGIMDNFESETNRLAKNFTPVRQNSDEIYNILRKRLFKNEFSEEDIEQISNSYAETIREANQMEISSETPEKFKSLVKDSFPFHPSMRDLYARFKENKGFMQTRGLIRLMRTITAAMFDDDNGWADRRYLIGPDDINLNDSDTASEINSINSTLLNAISSDIASQGSAYAERLDQTYGHDLGSRVANLILMSSLSSVENATRGLNESEIIRNISSPGIDVSKVKSEILPELKSNSLYLHIDNTGKYLYKNVQNVVAKLKAYVGGYNQESILKEIRSHLETMFKPQMKDCYQKVYSLASLDEITIDKDGVSLIIYRPADQQKIHPDLEKLYEDSQYQNRMLFLTGESSSMRSIYDNAASLKAANAIIEEFKKEKMPDNDPQFKEAFELHERYLHMFNSSVRETFVKLIYPTKNGLMQTSFTMQFQNNSYDGESQIRETLLEKRKFTTDITSDSFIKMAESKLFISNQNRIAWSELLRSSATRPDWPWHKTNALEELKNEMIRKDHWREEGNYIIKGPFEPSPTSVIVQQSHRDDNTGEVSLQIKPKGGDQVHYEIGTRVTEASSILDTKELFKTKEMKLQFLCVDSTGKRKMGKPVYFQNSVTMKYRFFGSGSERKMEIKAAPMNGTTIRYTTDGSDPSRSGGIYDSPFSIEKSVKYIVAIAENSGIYSEKIEIPVPDDDKNIELDNEKVTVFKRPLKTENTAETFEMMKYINQYGIQLSGIKIDADDSGKWASIAFDEKMLWDYEKLSKIVDFIQKELLEQGQISMEAKQMHFPSGSNFLDYVQQIKIEYRADELEQK